MSPMSKSNPKGHLKGRLFDDLHQLAAASDRRQFLRMMLGASLAPLVGCGVQSVFGALDGGTDAGAATDGAKAGDGPGAVTSCAKIPEETAGPYPGDGSNGPNALSLSGIVRRDMRPSFAGLSGTATGVPMTLDLRLVAANGACKDLAGYAIYAWHCDVDGKYSMYDLPNQNYLRAVQETDANGVASFLTIFPGCYAGRWPHIHFEVYPSLQKASSSGMKVATSQLALPEDACNVVYASNGYGNSAANLRQSTLAGDNVFNDGVGQQLAVVSGSVAGGYAATLLVGING